MKVPAPLNLKFAQLGTQFHMTSFTLLPGYYLVKHRNTLVHIESIPSTPWTTFRGNPNIERLMFVDYIP
jgi:hypothetical protein